jgi:hypothetical protein
MSCQFKPTTENQFKRIPKFRRAKEAQFHGVAVPPSWLDRLVG